MIRINKITRGRFGNKIFQYNNLIQLSEELGIEPSCVPWEGNEYFKKIVSFKLPVGPGRILYWNDILNDNTNLDNIREIIKRHKIQLLLDDPSYALHNTFHKLTKRDPRKYLELKDKYLPSIARYSGSVTPDRASGAIAPVELFVGDYIYVGIHIRGGDILGGNGCDGREIHTPEYYIEAINHLIEAVNKKTLSSVIPEKQIKFIVCTDDKSFISYKKTIEYLKTNPGGSIYELGPDTGTDKYINDFATLCYCDILINSSSTFCCAAVFIGKRDKIVFHSKDWMNRIVEGDFTNSAYKKYVNKFTNKMTDDEWRTTDGYSKAKYFWIDIKDNKVNYYKNIIFI